MKNKNIGGGCFVTQPDQQKRPNAKTRKKCKKLSNIENFSSLVSLTRNFTKFIFPEQLIAKPQFNMQNMFFFFFPSSHHKRTLYFICIIFGKKIIIYWLILTVTHQGSIFLFFCLHPVVQTFLYPSNFVIN